MTKSPSRQARQTFSSRLSCSIPRPQSSMGGEYARDRAEARAGGAVREVSQGKES